MTRPTATIALLLTILCPCATWSQTLVIPAQEVEIPTGPQEPWEKVGESHAPRVIPTAEHLSRTGNLQAYIDDVAKRWGDVPLPPGKIRCGDQLKLVRLDKVKIHGRGTTIVFTGDRDEPAIRHAQCAGLTLENLTLEFAGDLLWSMENWHGRATIKTEFHNVSFIKTGRKREGRALRFARTQSEATCADVLLSGCWVLGYDSALHVVGNQAVRILVTNNTDIWHCNRAWQIDGGGHLVMNGKSLVVGAKEIARTGPNAIGSSLQPVLKLEDVYVDDAGSPTRLLDMSATQQYWQKVVIRDVKCNVPDAQGDGFDLIIGPHESRFGAAVIDVSGLTKTGRANTEPVTPEPPGSN